MECSSCLCPALILVAIVGAFLKYFQWAFSYWSNRNVQGPKPEIPFGNVGAFSRRQQHLGHVTSKIYTDMKKKGLAYAGIYFSTKPSLMIIDMDLVKRVLTTDFQYFQERGIYFNEKRTPISANLFNLGGQKWKTLRSKLTPTFSSGKMKQMFQTLVDCSEDIQGFLDDSVRKSEPIDIKDLAACYTTDVIGSCAFGIDCNSLKNPDNEFRRAGKDSFKIDFLRHLRITLITGFPKLALMLNLSSMNDQTRDFYMNTVKEVVEYREANNVERNDFMNLLIKMKGQAHDPNSLTMNEISAQAFVFFVAGFETSSTTMTFCLYQLAENQDIQDKVRQEIRSVLAKHNGQINYEAINEMVYMEKVVQETLRMYPPVTNLSRKASDNYKIPGTDITVEKGKQVLIPVLGIHYDPEYYPNPEKFNPENFSDEAKKSRHSFTHLPFGDGPRICIGMRFGLMQTKVGLTRMLLKNRYTINPRTQTPIKFDPKNLVISAVGDVWLDVERVE